MNDGLQGALRSDLTLATLEDHLIQQAGVLYRMGFCPRRISPSQMATVGEYIRTASRLEEAKKEVEEFLQRQVKKLSDKAERSGKPASSWAATPQTGGGKQTLGHTLIQWVVEEKYLEKQTTTDLDRLDALQRFWSRFHGLYRYQAEMQHGMPLQSLQEEV